MRAAAEAMQSVVSKIPSGTQDAHGTDGRMIANRLAKKAGRDLEALRNSPELAQTHEFAAAKVTELNQAKNLVFDTADSLGDLAPNGITLHNTMFITALESVQQDSAGNFIFKE